MARIEFNGEAGTVWTNETGRVQYQLIVNWANSCGLCIQYDHAIGPWWPIPFHRGCNCRHRLIRPGESAAPFVDFRQKINELDSEQRGHVVGVPNLCLIDAGVVKWTDVVTSNRIRDFHELVSIKQLKVEQLVVAGVSKKEAEEAYAMVHTPEHEIAIAKRRESIDALRAMGVEPEQIKLAFGKEIAARVLSPKAKMSTEQILFKHADFTVTSSRFLVGSKTYAIKQIVSTRGIQIKPGCIGALIGDKVVYAILLTTAAGEHRAYSSKDPELIANLLEALDKAIVGA